MDLESYAESYSGHTRIARLHLIAKKRKGDPEALKLAFKEAKATGNVTKFRELWTEFHQDQEFSVEDRAWLEETEVNYKQNLARLEEDLNKHKASVVSKDSIRMTYQKLGALHVAFGDLENAMKAYMRARENCTLPAHILETCLDVIVVAVEVKNFSFVNNFITKADATSEGRQKIPAIKLRTASALGLIHSENYKGAALKLLECSHDIGDQWNSVITTVDIARYTTLCALATFSRSDLKTKVIESVAFKEFLELAPDMRELLSAFASSKYQTCISCLDKLKGILELDIHLQDHVERLYRDVRNRAMLQFLAPYSTVDLDKMCATFMCDADSLEKELCKLISDNQLKARIDSQKRILYAKQEDPQTQMAKQVQVVTSQYEHGALTLLLKANCLHHHYTVKRQMGAARHPTYTDSLLG